MGAEAEFTEGQVSGNIHRLIVPCQRRQPGPQSANLLKQKRRVFVGGQGRHKKAVGMELDHFDGLLADGAGAAQDGDAAPHT